jgi:non-ribosomal peptide synthetase component F
MESRRAGAGGPVRAQADRGAVSGSAPAVCAWEDDLTYGELDALSSALAAHLAERGVRPKAFVPLCFQKLRWATVAMVGVMKAGGAFLLLDPSHPRARPEGICRQVSAEVIVASEQNRAMAGDLADQVVLVGITSRAWTTGTTDCTRTLITPDNALYAIFTSRMTGTPKGAVIHHAAFGTSALSQVRVKRMTPITRVFQFSSYVFDVCSSDILTTMIAGGCACIPSKSCRKDNIEKSIDSLKVNWFAVPLSVARAVHLSDSSTIRTLVVGGKAMLRS